MAPKKTKKNVLNKEKKYKEFSIYLSKKKMVIDESETEIIKSMDGQLCGCCLLRFHTKTPSWYDFLSVSFAISSRIQSSEQILLEIETSNYVFYVSFAKGHEKLHKSDINYEFGYVLERNRNKIGNIVSAVVLVELGGLHVKLLDAISMVELTQLCNRLYSIYIDNNNHILNDLLDQGIVLNRLENPSKITKYMEEIYGHWFEIVNSDDINFNSIDKKIDGIKIAPFIMPKFSDVCNLHPNDKLTEEIYNIEVCKANSAMVRLDRKLVKRIETADILFDKYLIHVKICKGHVSSSTLSHLFSQGSVSARYLLDINNRKNVERILRINLQDYKSGDYTVVYVMKLAEKDMAKPLSELLPLFSRINLSHHYDIIKNLGYELNIKLI
jgi:hypothetical protein